MAYTTMFVKNRVHFFFLVFLFLMALSNYFGQTFAFAQVRPEDTANSAITRSEHLEDLLTRTQNNLIYDSKSMAALFDLKLPPSQGVPVYINFIERYVDGNITNNKIHQDYAWATLQSIESLRDYREDAISAVPILLRIMQPEQKWQLMREVALDALLEIAPEDPRLKPFLLTSMNEGNEEMTHKVISTIASMGVKGSFAIPNLLRIISLAPQTDRACLAFEALGQITKDQFQFAPHDAFRCLVKIDSLSPEESSAVLATIKNGSSNATPAINDLLNVLNGTKLMYVRYSVIAAIRQSGVAAKPNVLKELLKYSYVRGDNYNVVIQLVRETILQSVGPKTTEAIPILTASLRSRSYNERRFAAIALSKIGKSAHLVTPIIINSMKDEMKAGDYAGISIYTTVLSSLGKMDTPVSESIFEMMRPNSPFLSEEYNMDDFRPYWLEMIAVSEIPRDERKRQFILDQTLKGLKTPNAEDFGIAAKVAGEMNAEASYLVNPLTLKLKLGERAGGLISSNNDQHQYHGDYIFNWQYPNLIIGFKEVIHALGKFGADANFAVPILQRYSKMPADAPLAAIRPDVQIALQQIETDKSKTLVNSNGSTLKAKLKALKVIDIRGKNIPLHGDQLLTLFFFADTTCPCVQAYIERLRGLELKYRSNIQLIVVFPNPQEGVSKIQNFATEKKIPGSIIRDDRQQIIKLFKAQRTAQTILIDKDGAVRYSGRIDDNIYNIKLVKDKALENAIHLVIQGKNTIKPGVLPMSCELVY